MKEVGAEIMADEDIFAQSMAMNPEMEMMPPAAKVRMSRRVCHMVCWCLAC